MMSATEKKVYEYDAAKVRDTLVDVFRRRKGEATTADLVALTGLPKSQVEAEVKAVSDEYGARLRVTESGEILYSFPSGMRSRYRGFGPRAVRAWKAFRKGLAKVAAVAFKVWIVVMLVGYFVLFIALAVLAMLASVAISASGNSRDSRSSGRGGGLGGMFITGQLLNTIFRIWFYSELFMTPEQRAARAGRRRERRPLYKAIYSFVFGDGDPDAGWDTVEKKAFVAFVQANKGLVTMPEFMALTGLGPLEAEAGINRYLYEFEGSPEVTEGGTIYYFFPSLLRRKDKSDRSFGSSVPMRRIAPFSSNDRKANATFCVFNGVNLLFGSYFFYEAGAPHALLQTIYSGQYATKLVTVGGLDGFYYFTHQLLGKLAGMAHPAAFLGFALGLVPLAFSLFFYAIPAIRARRLAARNERAREENMRRVAYRTVLDSPIPVRPESLPLREDVARPRKGHAAAKALSELAAWSGAEPEADGSYSFAEIARGKAEAAKARAAVDEKAYELGGVAFDSDAHAE
jgi:hypothetical protein